MKPTSSSFSTTHFLWDLWCIGSIVGIWPRFIEPYLLETTTQELKIPSLPQDLEGLKILQFTDLHLRDGLPDSFLDKLIDKIMALKPDMIVFTGDFLCYAKTESLARLSAFLNRLHAPHGCYAILGNHDYQEWISINPVGEYDTLPCDTPTLQRGLSRLFKLPHLAKKSTKKALETPPNIALATTLKNTPFRLLHNECVATPIGNAFLNICGLGEYIAGRAIPKEAFAGYNKEYPGIILLHNPDGVRLLDDYPGDLVLCGHTHGGQVYLPWLWKRFTQMENMDMIRGLHKHGNKTVYINRGVGGLITFRWHARPEIHLVTLRGSS